jgi:PAS domain S-box-containing protein
MHTTRSDQDAFAGHEPASDRFRHNRWFRPSTGWDDRLVRLLTPHRLWSLPAVWRYGLGLIFVVAATALRWALIPWLGTEVPHSIAIPAVVATTVLLGTGPGLLSMVLLIISDEGFILGSFPTMWTGATLARLGASLAAGVVVVGVLHALRVAALKAQQSAARLAAFATATFEGVFESQDGRIVVCNEQFAQMMGRTMAELKGMAIADLIAPEDRERVAANICENRESVMEHGALRKDGTRIVVEARGRPASPNSPHRYTGIRDITNRRRAEQEQKVAVEFLRLVNAHADTRQLVEASVRFFHEQSGCEAVGIRLRDGDDYPYYEAHGFPEEFLRLENSLCIRDPDGTIQRDHAGDPVMACMCGNVICGRLDPSKPFFTSGGSFWANDTTRLLATTTDADRQTPTRNRCNGQGYESVALVALRCGEERLGLLQLNDRRKGMFTAESIALWERLAGYLGVALANARAQESLRKAHAELE